MTTSMMNTSVLEPQPDFVLFVVASYSVGQGRIRQLRAQVCSSVKVPSDLIRLDTRGPDLLTRLDDLVASGHRVIRVQPLGLPLSDSLLHWLPGVLAHWRQLRSAPVEVLLGSDQVALQAGWSAFLTAMLDEPATLIDDSVKPALGKPGWTEVPAFRFHLLVCTGPRCQIHGSTPLLQQLQQSCRRFGVYQECLFTSTGCLFPCNQGPVVALYPQGRWYRLSEPDTVDDFVRDVLVSGQAGARYLVHQVALPHSPSKETLHGIKTQTDSDLGTATDAGTGANLVGHDA